MKHTTGMIPLATGYIRQQKKSKPKRSMNAARLNMRRKKKNWTGFMNWKGKQGTKLSNI